MEPAVTNDTFDEHFKIGTTFWEKIFCFANQLSIDERTNSAGSLAHWLCEKLLEIVVLSFFFLLLINPQNHLKVTVGCKRPPKTHINSMVALRQ